MLALSGVVKTDWWNKSCDLSPCLARRSYWKAHCVPSSPSESVWVLQFSLCISKAEDKSMLHEHSKYQSHPNKQWKCHLVVMISAYRSFFKLCLKLKLISFSERDWAVFGGVKGESNTFFSGRAFYCYSSKDRATVSWSIWV